MVLLFDAANTLIHKPLLFEKAAGVLESFGHSIPMNFLKQRHKLVSEIIVFPDRTDKEFYRKFNSEWLYALGILPKDEILNGLFEACSYLPWEKFEDTEILSEIKGEKAILSNFHGSLTNLIESKFPGIFKEIVISENEKFRKPDSRFYLTAIEKLKVEPKDILYIGDSLKLDVEPAESTGIRSLLIDRDNEFPYFKNRIQSFKEITKFI
ncbi:MAG TPA: HAD family hydrolase [Bacteroidia bacterium]